MRLLYKQICLSMTELKPLVVRVLTQSGLEEPGLKELHLAEGLDLNTLRSQMNMNELQTNIYAYCSTAIVTFVTCLSIAM